MRWVKPGQMFAQFLLGLSHMSHPLLLGLAQLRLHLFLGLGLQGRLLLIFLGLGRLHFG